MTHSGSLAATNSRYFASSLAIRPSKPHFRAELNARQLASANQNVNPCSGYSDHFRRLCDRYEIIYVYCHWYSHWFKKNGDFTRRLLGFFLSTGTRLAIGPFRTRPLIYGLRLPLALGVTLTPLLAGVEAIDSDHVCE